MAKARTRRTKAKPPAIPRGLRTASPATTRKLLSSINHCWDALDYQRFTLEQNLKQLGDEVPRELRTRYRDTLKSLTQACNLIQPIVCGGPFMSFELPLLKGEVKGDVRRRRPRR